MDIDEAINEEQLIRKNVERFVNKELKPLADEMEEKQYVPKKLHL